MLFVCPIKKDRRVAFDIKEFTDNTDDNAELDLLPIVKMPRSEVPAVTHVDYSARLQTISASDNPGIYALVNSFYKKTGCPVVVNTSFNVRGEPIAESPEDAYKCFMNTEMDLLIFDNVLLLKEKQPKFDWIKKGVGNFVQD
jgi:carbamoyltransferase